MDTEYNYVKETYDLSRLTKEIQDSSITIVLSHIDSLGNDLCICFKADLSQSEKSTLDSLVVDHTGEPLPAAIEEVIATISKIVPFGDKNGFNFDGRGVQFTIDKNSVNQTTVCEFTVPTGIYEFSGMSLINDGDVLGDHGNVLIKDDASGTYSGYPNATLNQFATNWNIKPHICENMLPYTATLYSGMRIVIEYTNSKDINKAIYVNFNLHRHV